jgi:hypothetical protein
MGCTNPNEGPRLGQCASLNSDANTSHVLEFCTSNQPTSQIFLNLPYVGIALKDSLGPSCWGRGAVDPQRIHNWCDRTSCCQGAVESDHLNVGWVECLKPISLICPHLVLLEGLYLLFKDLLYICWCYICDSCPARIDRSVDNFSSQLLTKIYWGSRSPHLVCCHESWISTLETASEGKLCSAGLAQV